MQLTHYNTTFINRSFPIILLCDNINQSSNIGSLFRISDAFGVEKLILCGKDIKVGRKVTKVSRSTENSVDYEINHNVLNTIKAYNKKGYQIIGLEITSNSKPLHKTIINTNQPICLVLGNENFGISEQVLKLCHYTIYINMFGKNTSMNVAQAANIALYEITKQFL